MPGAQRGAGFQPGLCEAGGGLGPAQGPPTFQCLGPGNREGPRQAQPSARKQGTVCQAGDQGGGLGGRVLGAHVCPRQEREENL